MSRDEMIALLISDTLEKVMNLRQVFMLQGILENGFLGYTNWSDEELRQELHGRGFGSDDSPVDAENWDTFDQGDNDDFLRFAEHLGSNWQTPQRHGFSDF